MEIEIIVALTTGILALITSIVSSYITFKKSGEIEKLKNKLEIEKEKIKFVLKHETENFSQYYISLKEFLTTTQRLKDEIRLIYKRDTFQEEKEKALQGFEDKIIEQYANYVLFYKMTDPDLAHTIKNLFFMIFHKMREPRSESSIIFIEEKLLEISKNQKELKTVMESEIDTMLIAMENNSL